jgi:hypothetical protein
MMVSTRVVFSGSLGSSEPYCIDFVVVVVFEEEPLAVALEAAEIVLLVRVE